MCLFTAFERQRSDQWKKAFVLAHMRLCQGISMCFVRYLTNPVHLGKLINRNLEAKGIEGLVLCTSCQIFPLLVYQGCFVSAITVLSISTFLIGAGTVRGGRHDKECLLPKRNGFVCSWRLYFVLLRTTDGIGASREDP